MLRYADSHAHLTSEWVYPHLEEYLIRARQAGIETLINICTDQETLEKGIDLAQRHQGIYTVAATTPHDVDADPDRSFFSLVEKRAKEGLLVAIGETGLDYHYNHSSPETQRVSLKRFLQLAIECDLPVVIHCREAFSDFFAILDEESKEEGIKGVLHCFTGTSEEAEELVRRNWFISFSGIVTFKKSDLLREALSKVPLSHILIETDTPYLAPQSKRGQLNEPSYLPEVAQMIAQVKGVSLEEVAQQTYRNVQQLFRLA